ncbi:hypothetical protein WJX74_002187 [Apatococcus lobatus]|uniref:Uncharacterized protein n=1 Tax=Apatococcus lobatus TaxID=904363 RepID=A0AAW1RD28_9CHLO
MADVDMIGKADWTPADLALAVATCPPSEASTVLQTIVAEMKAISGITDPSAASSQLTEPLSKVLLPWYCLEQPLLGLLAKFEAEMASPCSVEGFFKNVPAVRTIVDILIGVSRPQAIRAQVHAARHPWRLCYSPPIASTRFSPDAFAKARREILMAVGCLRFSSRDWTNLQTDARSMRWICLCSVASAIDQVINGHGMKTSKKLPVQNLYAPPVGDRWHQQGVKQVCGGASASNRAAAKRMSMGYQTGKDFPAGLSKHRWLSKIKKDDPAANLKPVTYGFLDGDPHDFSSGMFAAIRTGRVDHAQALLHAPRAVLEPAHFKAVVARGCLLLLELMLHEPVRMEAHTKALAGPAHSLDGRQAVKCYSRHRYQEGCATALWEALIMQGNNEMVECVLNICMKPAHPFFASTMEASQREVFKRAFLLGAAKAGNLQVVNEVMSAMQCSAAQDTMQFSDLFMWQKVLMRILLGSVEEKHPARGNARRMQEYLCTIEAILQHPMAGHASRATFIRPMFSNAATKIGVPVLDMLQSLAPPCDINADLMACAISSEDAAVIAWAAARQPSPTCLPQDAGASWHWHLHDHHVKLYAAAQHQLASILDVLLSEDNSPAKDFPYELTLRICRLLLPPLQQEGPVADMTSIPVSMVE